MISTNFDLNKGWGMARLSKDGQSIEFKATDNIPTSVKKFRQSPEIQGFYSFVYDNGLQQEAYDIICRIADDRKAARAAKAAEKRNAKKK